MTVFASGFVDTRLARSRMKTRSSQDFMRDRLRSPRRECGEAKVQRGWKALECAEQGLREHNAYNGPNCTNVGHKCAVGSTGDMTRAFPSLKYGLTGFASWDVWAVNLKLELASRWLKRHGFQNSGRPLQSIPKSITGPRARTSRGTAVSMGNPNADSRSVRESSHTSRIAHSTCTWE